MSQYFEYKCNLHNDVGGANLAVTASAWSVGDQPLLAVATENGAVAFFAEEGERVEDMSFIRNGKCLAMAWHPKLQILASSWDDGSVCIWNEKDRVKREETGVHKHSSVKFLMWSPEGSRLISGDQNGVLGVWQCDSRARLLPLCQFAKKGAITHCTFQCSTSGSAANVGVNSSSGDSSAAPPFFFATDAGAIYFADDLGHCTEVVSIGCSVRLLQYVGNKQFLLALGADAVLHKFGSMEGGGLRQDRKAKLAIKGDGSNLMCVWAGAGLIAAANNESLVRVWHVEQDTHYVLQLNDVRHMAAPKDAIRTLSFNPRSRVLVGGTAMGRVCFWHFIGSQVSADVSSTKKVVEPSETDWDVLSPVSVSSSAIESLDFGVGESGLVCTRTAGTVSILNETILHCRQSGGNAAIQLTAEKLIIQTSDGKTKKLNSAIRIKGVSIAGKNIMVWSGKKAEVHELVDGNVSPISAFFTKAVACALHKEDIFLAVGQRVEMCSLQGVVKKVLSFADTEGQPISIDVWGDCLAVVSNTSHVKLWDISRREPKQLLPGRSFESVLGPGGSIRSVRVNAKGTKLSFLCSRADGDTGMVSPSSNIQVYDVETDTLASYNFGPEYFPVSHFWDPTEPKLLAVQTRRHELAAVDSADSSALHVADSGSSSASAAAASLFAAQSDARTSAFGASEDQTSSNVASDDEIRRAEGEVNMLFATGDNGVKLQDSFTLPPGDTLMGLDVPNLIFMSRPVDEARGSISIPKVKLRQMRDFVGLNVAILDEDTKADLINFSYNLCIGNMDEAFRSVKKIAGNSGIWENMAHMCVKTQRLDVAEVCLGNMGNAKGAAAVRKAKEEPEPAVAVAQLAIQLGLLNDAEQLYLQCGRYDLLVMLYAAWGRWPAALALAEKHDRIHLKSVCYQYACALEQTGDIKNAIKFYERAGTHRTDVPRMMLAAGRGADLDKYVQTADDAELSKWLAAYAESRQQYETAIQVYTTGKDWVSVVRVLCFQQNYARAAEVCIESEDAPACFHLARQYEMQDKIKEAMQFFQRARRYNHAVRLAKQHRMYTELLTMALESNNRLVQLDAAYHLEQIGMPDKAVLLYQKGGQLGRALELCFRSELFDSIRIIADELGADTDPAVLSQCGAFFLQRGQYDKAVHLLVIGNEFERALDICTQYQAKLSEEDADRMTAEKLPPTAADEQKEQRNAMLRRIAKIAKDQGNFVLACKKYTSAGDKVRAIKCLLKNGDTEKVIYYATYAKKPEIYMLAAAYLQNVDWHNDPEIMKAIIKFYTAAGAMLELATFYEACAQVEVDDFRDYEKALLALKEALKYVVKAKQAPGKTEKLNSLDQRIRLVERFVEARKCAKTDSAEMIKICNQLLDQVDIESAIRVGDVFALLIEYFYAQNSSGGFQQAYNLLERMQDRNIVIAPYLDQAIIDRVYAAVGVAQQQPAQQPNRQQDEINDEIEEDM